MKKLLSVILVTALLLSMGCITAFADEPVTYELWVNNEQITSDHLTVQCGDGTATFDPASATLTLDNAAITQGVPYEQLYTGVLTYLPHLTVVVKGDCTITETGGDGIGSYNFESYQIGDVIYPAPYDITVTGDGTLTITESSGMYGYGLYCTGKLVLDGADLTINSSSTGVWANELEIRDTKADIHCTSTFSGIVVNRGNFDYESSTVTAVSDKGAGLLIGSDIDVATLTVNSGSLSLKGKIGVQNVTAKSVVEVKGGRLSVEGEIAAFDETFLADEAANIVTGEGVSVTSGSIDGNSCVIEAPSADTFTVSGTFTSYLNKPGVTIELLQNGEQIDYAGYQDDTGSYSFTDVPAGSYTLRVSKKNHVTRDYEITVSADTTQNVKICPKGDVSGDGKVTTKDSSMAFQKVQGKLDLDAYQIKCGDVVRNDNKITSNDVSRIFQHAQGRNKLW